MNFTYEGTVNLYFTSKNGKQTKISSHNTGTNNLFQFLAQALYGLNTADESPCYLDIREAYDGDSLLTAPIPIVDKTYGLVSGKYTAIFRTQILRSYFLPSASLDGDKCLCLLNKNNKLFAYMTVSGIGQISATTQGLVEWNMNVDNPQS